MPRWSTSSERPTMVFPNLVPRAFPLKVGGAPPTFKGKALGTRLGFSVQMVHNGYKTQPLDMRTGVRQGCLLSPLLFSGRHGLGDEDSL